MRILQSVWVSFTFEEINCAVQYCTSVESSYNDDDKKYDDNVLFMQIESRTFTAGEVFHRRNN